MSQDRASCAHLKILQDFRQDAYGFLLRLVVGGFPNVKETSVNDGQRSSDLLWSKEKKLSRFAAQSLRQSLYGLEGTVLLAPLDLADPLHNRVVAQPELK